MAAVLGRLHLQQIPRRLTTLGTAFTRHFVKQLNTSSKSSQGKCWGFSWPIAGSFIVGTALGYQVHKHYTINSPPKSKQDKSLVEKSFKVVNAKAIRVEEGEKSSSGSPPHSKTFNFIADAVEAVATAVVYIEVTGRHAGFFGSVGATSSGSGFIVTEEGIVLTNAHVLENAVDVSVRLADGREFSGVVVDIDPVKDLAAIKLKAKQNIKFPVLKLGISSKLRPGEWVVAMGSPLQLSNTITSGIVSTVHRAGEELGLPNSDMEYIQTDAAINVGNSGGPLVNLDGEVIGINAITVQFASGISFAIPVDAAKEFLNRAIEKEKTGNYSKKGQRTLGPYQQRYIGISMLTLTPPILEELRRRNPGYSKVTKGVLVARVNYGSPAHRCGMQSGDVIVSINGNSVSTSKQVYDFVSQGETLKVELKRGSKTLRLDVQPQILGS